MRGTYTPAESAYVERVKNLPCSLCDVPGPSDAHHVRQGLHYLVVALCKDCHQGNSNGWHGERVLWTIAKKDEIDALAVTIERLAEEEG